MDVMRTDIEPPTSEWGIGKQLKMVSRRERLEAARKQLLDVLGRVEAALQLLRDQPEVEAAMERIDEAMRLV